MKNQIALVVAAGIVVLAAPRAFVAAQEKQADKQTADIPVTRVVLFSSGVGYFEHSGTIDGNATARLMFKADQINDVLKSMVVMAEGGSVTGVNYASQDPILRALKSFGVDMSGAPGMADLLQQLRGAEVTVLAPDKIVGRIIGVEGAQEQVLAGGNSVIIVKHNLNLMTPEGIKSVPLKSIQNLIFADDKLAKELSKALDVLLTSHDTQRKPVDVNFAAAGKSAVRIGYIVETPIWKTTYRLEFRKDKKPILQGWAIVENTSDTDWSKVSLSLVSGRPISFVQDLYTPLYMPRPVVQPELYASLRPQTYEEGMEKAKEQKRLAEADGETYAADQLKRTEAAGRQYAAKGAAPAAPGAMARYSGKPAADANVSLEGGGGVASLATAAKAGELFQFTIKDPVDLSRRRSAMLPVINNDIAAEKVSIYNPSVMPRNPLNGAYITNDTGMKMLGGPITVFDGGAYAGDARIDNIAEKDKRLISYAVDLNVLIDSTQKTSSAVTAVKISGGVMTIQRSWKYSQKYTIINKADEPRIIIIEHPFNADRKLISPEKFEEKTGTHYRFRVEVPKASEKEFEVAEEQIIKDQIAIMSYDVGTLTMYSRNDEIPKAVKDALAKAIELKVEMERLVAKIAEMERQVQTITAGEDRIRKNIETFGKDSPQGQEQMKKLAEAEKKIDELNAAIAETRTQLDKKRKELEDYVKDLKID